MIVEKAPFVESVRDILWPTFTPLIEDKHGDQGIRGTRGEAFAIDHLEKLGAEYVIDHSEDVISQFQGIDLTAVYRDRIETIDVKYGKTGLYWDKYNKFWYITAKNDFWNPRKTNSYIMHVGPKGDVYVKYNKLKLKELMSELHKRGHKYKTSQYGDILPLRLISSIVTTNLW